MAKISKAVAEQVAGKLVQKIQEEINKVEGQIEDIVIPLYEASIPVDVMKEYKKNPKWFRETFSVNVKGEGINHRYRTISLRDQYPTNISGTEYVELNSKQATLFTKLENKKETLKEKKKITRLEIENTLLALGTYKRILEELPETAPYLPVREGKALMHVPSAIKEKIQCLVQPDNKKCLETI